MKPAAPSDRRQRARQARDAFPAMGIYAIRDTASGWARVGSSRNVVGTLNRIQFELRMGTHLDRSLQARWRSNPSCLVFEVLERVKERSDPDFDYAAELALLEELHRAELGLGSST